MAFHRRRPTVGGCFSRPSRLASSAIPPWRAHVSRAPRQRRCRHPPLLCSSRPASQPAMPARPASSFCATTPACTAPRQHPPASSTVSARPARTPAAGQPAPCPSHAPPTEPALVSVSRCGLSSPSTDGMTSRSPSGGSGEYAPLHHTLDPSHRRESINGWTPSPRPGALGVPAFDRSPASLDRASRSSVPPGLWTVPLPASISSDRPVSHSASYSQTVQMGARATPPNGRHLQPQARDSPLSKTPSRLAHSGSGSSLPPSDWRWPYVGNGSSQSGWAMRELTPSHVNARLPQAHALSGSPGSQSPQHLDRSEITTPRGCFPPFQPQTFGLSCPSQDNPRTAASSVTSASTLSSRSGPSSRPVLSGSLASPDDKALGSQVLTDGDGQGYHGECSTDVRCHVQ